MASVLPYTSKDTKYDNAKFRRRTPLKVSPNLSRYIGNCCDDHHFLCRVCLDSDLFAGVNLVIQCGSSTDSVGTSWSCVCLFMMNINSFPPDFITNERSKQFSLWDLLLEMHLLRGTCFVTNQVDSICFWTDWVCQTCQGFSPIHEYSVWEFTSSYAVSFANLLEILILGLMTEKCFPSVLGNLYVENTTFVFRCF